MQRYTCKWTNYDHVQYFLGKISPLFLGVGKFVVLLFGGFIYFFEKRYNFWFVSVFLKYFCKFLNYFIF